MHSSSLFDVIEGKWITAVSIFLEEHFKQRFLPSHDQTHHQRVWRNAKALISGLKEIGCPIDEELVESVFLSTMFHDTGMTITVEPDHGTASFEILSGFLNESVIKIIAPIEEIRQAITEHDKKDRIMIIRFEPGMQPDVLALTSIADDMDALGTIGIYRYAEIYLHREATMELLGHRVLENVSNRYSGIKNSLSSLPFLLNQIEEQFREIQMFYEGYNQQASSAHDPFTEYSGPQGVINHIRNYTINSSVRPEDIHGQISDHTSDIYVLNFFKKLSNEIKNN